MWTDKNAGDGLLPNDHCKLQTMRSKNAEKSNQKPKKKEDQVLNLS